jgi:hypothetical protein
MFLAGSLISMHAQIDYMLGGQMEKPFSAGKYRVISKGWVDQNEENISIWDDAEFTVE